MIIILIQTFEIPTFQIHEEFSNSLEKRVSLKFKTLRFNQVPFMKKKSKAIISKSRLINKYLKWTSRENFLAYKKVKSKGHSLNKKATYLLSRSHQKTYN